VHEAWIYTAATLLALWGAAHLVNTPRVIPSLHPSTVDDRRVITMEWINEGLTLVFLAGIAITVTLLGDTNVTRSVLWGTVIMLNVMSAVSLATGFRVKFIAYRLCPVIFTGSSLLIVAGLL
jgi:hypothetical protein